MKHLLIVSSLLLLPVSFSYADQHMHQKSASQSSSTSMGHDAHYLDSFSAHHRDGIAMARLAEQRAQDPELKKLAAKTVKEQTQEIDQMKKWRDQYFPNVQSQEEAREKVNLTKLEQAQGKEFDAEFARMMIKHHEEGIKLSKDMTGDLKNEKIKSFAERSVTKQNEEIKRLNEISRKLDRRS